METQTVLFAFGLTLIAGLATGIGSAAAFFARATNTKLLSFSLGLSAGVMIYVSFVELFAEARKTLIAELGAKDGYLLTVAAFFAGVLLIAIIDRLVPEAGNPHEVHKIEEIDAKQGSPKDKKLLRMGMLAAVAIAIHNFPEGIATFTGALKDIKLGIPIAVAISIHNIPEGIAVSVPIYYATGSRKKAFFYSFLSGLAEPLGAVIGYVVLAPFLNDVVFGVLFALVAGIMVFISLDELLPTAQEYGEHHLSAYGLVVGMVVMAVSLILLA
ncbi:MAG: zinc transporter ZupT [Candidatus Aminicenantes bacterium]|nr:zinc transporter ZupT [Candidatus Aminicenantes bacterium]